MGIVARHMEGCSHGGVEERATHAVEGDEADETAVTGSNTVTCSRTTLEEHRPTVY